MSQYGRIQNAINFIEDNLNKPISLADVSKAAFSSLSYFHRIFYFMTGFTLKEYIRKRRFSEAAHALRCSSKSITDIALDACFETPESFTRAFKKEYGVSPREFRQSVDEVSAFDRLDILKTYALDPEPKLDFAISLDYVLYKEVLVEGFLLHTTIDNNQMNTDIPDFANEIFTHNKLAEHFDLSQTPVFGVCSNMTDENEFDYTLACLQKACVKPSDILVKHVIPGSRYAKFSFNRLDRIKEAWEYIYGVWFPRHDELRTKGFDFEIYRADSVDIYIPMSQA